MSKARRSKPQDAGTGPTTSLSSSKALVFISHDGRDAALAEAFSVLLSSVTCGMLKSFRSSDKSGTQGLEYGSEWYREIMKYLEQASDVVCLLTEHSLNRPWILYEAGVAKGKLDTPVHGLALGLTLEQTSTGPFAQFQNCDGNVDSVVKLVTQLARRLPNADPQRDIVNSQVVEFRKKVDDILKRPANKGLSGTTDPDGSTSAKLFEEIKVMFQELPDRLENQIVQAVEPQRRHRRHRDGMPPIDYLMHLVTAGEVDPTTAWLIVISQFRDELPWLYEIGLKVYRVMETGKPSEVRMAIEALRLVMHRLRHSPFIGERSSFRSVQGFVDELFESFSRWFEERDSARRGSARKGEK